MWHLPEFVVRWLRSRRGLYLCCIDTLKHILILLCIQRILFFFILKWSFVSAEWLLNLLRCLGKAIHSFRLYRVIICWMVGVESRWWRSRFVAWSKFMWTVRQEWLNMFGTLIIMWIIRIWSLMKKYTHFSHYSVEYTKLLYRPVKFNDSHPRNKVEWNFCVCRNSVLTQFFYYKCLLWNDFWKLRHWGRGWSCFQLSPEAGQTDHHLE